MKELERLLSIVSILKNIDIELIKGGKRNYNIVYARQLYMYCAVKLNISSFEVIGLICMRDHSTVSHTFKKVENQKHIYNHWELDIEDILREFNSYPCLVQADINLLQLVKNYEKSFIN